MIKILDRGSYKKFKTCSSKIIFSLESNEMHGHETTYVLDRETQPSIQISTAPTRGKYRRYWMKNENGFTEGTHVELLFEKGIWQGYLLLEHFHLMQTEELITQCICTNTE
ncbi:MAG: hypothetical protein M3Q44_00150 [bacterium]|nr:hypothetical protein [bacterium]